METALTLLIFLGVMVVTGMIFFLWIVVMLGRGLFRAITAMMGTRPAQPMPMVAGGIVCKNEKCRALNVDSARFCRRCGVQVSRSTFATTRRVAMW